MRLPLTVQTSSRRYQGRVLRTVLGWAAINMLFELGVPAAELARLYPPPRSRGASADRAGGTSYRMATRAKDLRLSPVRSLPWALAAELELLVLLLVEARMPLRPPTERKSRRVARNTAIAAGAGLANAALERELVGAVARAVVRRRIGILQWLRPRESAETAVAVAPPRAPRRRPPARRAHLGLGRMLALPFREAERGP